MRNSDLIPMIAMGLCLAGCGKPGNSVPVAERKAAAQLDQPAPAAPNALEEKVVDPLLSFKDVVSRTQRALTALTHVWNDPGTGAWKKSRFDMDNLDYDVKKSDSLVSPYEATMSFEMLHNVSGEVSAEEQAEAIPTLERSVKPPTDFWRVSYVFQGENWAIKSMENRTHIKVPLSDGEKTLMDTGWIKPRKEGWGGLIASLIEQATRK